MPATMASSTRQAATAILLLVICLLGAKGNASCPEDSVLGDDDECRCVTACPKPSADCQPGQQAVRVREAEPENPGRCCPLYECRHPGAEVNASVSCPEDSVLGYDGVCRCVSPCPKHDCQPGQQPVRVRDAQPESPGSCCPLYECRQPETLNYVKPEEQQPYPSRRQCMDGWGQPRDNGESWVGDDPCVNCTCEAGRLSCHVAMCARRCARPLPRAPGECCPRCPETTPGPRPGPPGGRWRCAPLRGCALDCAAAGGFERDERGCPVCRCRSSKQSQNEVGKPEDDGLDESYTVRDYDDASTTTSSATVASTTISTTTFPTTPTTTSIGTTIVTSTTPAPCPTLRDCNLLDCEYGLLMDELGCAVCGCRTRPPQDEDDDDDECPMRLECRRSCPRGYALDERGCPTCRCLGDCLDELNESRPLGSIWSRGPCRSCVCQPGGRALCNETVCSVACGDPLPPPPGHCCPLCPIQTPNDPRSWSTVPCVLIAVLALLCVLLMVRLVRGRFRARLTPAAIAAGAGSRRHHQHQHQHQHQHHGYPPQYYKCVPAYESHAHPVLLSHTTEKTAPPPL